MYVFTLCFGVLLYNTTGFKGLDVISSLILIVLYGVFLIGTKNRSFHIGFLVLILVFLFYLNYSFYIANNTWNAITIDFLTQLRPYFTFFIVSQMSPTFTEKQKSILKKISFYLWIFFIPIGLLATINPSLLTTMLNQPSNYTACITCLSIVYLYCSNFSVKDKLTFILMLSIGLININAQFTVFFLVVCGLIMYFHQADILKNNLKTGLALASISSLIIYISRSEIINYLSTAGFTGSGFASNATQYSSDFFSQINNYGFNPINGLLSHEWFSSGSVSFYPFLSQLGIIGFLLYLSFWIYIISSAIIQFKQKGEIQPFIIVVILASFIFLENISYSFFTSNKGYFMMMFIGLLLGNPTENDTVNLYAEKKTKKKKRTTWQLLQFIGRKNPPFSDEKDITYLIPTVPVSKKEETMENLNISIDTSLLKPVDKHEYEMSASLSVSKEDNKDDLVDDFSQDKSKTDFQQHNTSAMSLVGDEDDWEDDYDEEYDEEYDWEDEQEDENVEESNISITEEDKKEMEITPLQFSSSILTNATHSPVMTYTFNQSEESLFNKTVYHTEVNSDEDFLEGSFNYTI